MSTSQGSDLMKELYIDRGITQCRAGLYEDGRLIDLYIENSDIGNLAGNIYIGRIENVVTGLNAAFVNIGTGKNALLHFEDTAGTSDLKRGQDIIVQVIREGAGDKGPRVTGRIRIPGKYIVLLPGSRYTGISRKISDEGLRSRFKSLSKSFAEEGFGLIIRSEASNAREEDIIKEYEYLKLLWQDIVNKCRYIKPPVLLFNSRRFIDYIFREFVKQDIEYIYVNNDEDLTHLKVMIKNFYPASCIKVKYDMYNFSGFDKLERDIEALFNKRINLPSGGYLLIDRTEAFTSIDVNTGSSIANSEDKDIIFNTNIEACSAIRKAVVLLNLSGIILIDFIDMRISEEREQILLFLKEQFKSDRISSRIYGFTSLGLVEMARSRKGKRTSELVYLDEGKDIYSSAFALKSIENTCARLSRQYNKNKFRLHVSSYLFDELGATYKDFQKLMLERYGVFLEFIKADFIENYRFRDYDEEDYAKVELNNKTIMGKVIKYEENNEGVVSIDIKVHD